MISNVSGALLPNHGAWSASVAGRTVTGHQTYADVPPNEALALVGSHGFVEIAVHRGDARRTLGVRFGNGVANPLGLMIGRWLPARRAGSVNPPEECVPGRLRRDGSYFVSPVCFSASVQVGLMSFLCFCRQARPRPSPIFTSAQYFLRSGPHWLAAYFSAVAARSSCSAAS